MVLSMLQALAVMGARKLKLKLKLKLKALPLPRLRAVVPAPLYDCPFLHSAHHRQCNHGLAVTKS